MSESNTEGKRKLASIQRISAINPIEGADRIECAQVLGWKVVVKKDEFTAGEKAIYIEVDSLLPAHKKWCEFLQDKNKPEKPIRLKTIKLRGQISQGLLVPVTALLEYGMPPLELAGDMFPYEVGNELTELLEIEKYEPYIPAQLAGKVRGAFPPIVPKTDELRIQSYPDLIQEFAGKEVYITTKVDGSSGTFIMNDGDFQVCSRNWSLYEDDSNSFWQVARDNNLQEKLEKMGNFVIQGEVAGQGIQKNHLKLDKVQLFVFNVYDLHTGYYLDYEDFIQFCEDLELQTVPIDLVGEFRKTWDVDFLLTMAQGRYEGTKNPREGIVIRPTHGFRSEVTGHRASFKVINNDFLLRGGD